MYDGFKVKHVMNVTDVGHLTSDSDEGEDKIEKSAAKEGKTASEVAEFYLKVFKEDFKKLNVISPDIWCKATEHISEQLKLIKKLDKKGFTYKTSDGIYFDTSKFKDYGKLSGLGKIKLLAGKRISLKEKKNITDFALWKFSGKPGVRQQEWDSIYGLGFPGWHLECSAMSMKYLGEHFDIHTGGVDHINIHHTNEIAQSEAASGKKFVNYWVHGEFLTSKGKKISKSTGGLYTISELEKLGFGALMFRYFTFSAHYRKQLDFSLDGLENSKNSYLRIKNIISGLKDDGFLNKKYLDEFESKINNDLDMPGALSVLWNLLRDEKAKGKIKTISKMDKIFGLDLLKKDIVKIPLEILKLAEKRRKLRADKKWDEADKIRDKILEKGWLVQDVKDGPKKSKIFGTTDSKESVGFVLKKKE